MKCPRCGEEMYSTISGGSDSVRGNYTETKHICPKCHYEVSDNFNDLVYRAPFFKPDNSVTVTNYGWICPKCGAVLSPSIQECPYCTPYKVTCGPDSVSSIKSVPLTDVTSQPQVYSPQTLRDNITVTSNGDLRVKESK